MDPVHGTRPWAVVDPFEVYWMRSKAPSDAEPTHHFEVLELIKGRIFHVAERKKEKKKVKKKRECVKRKKREYA